MKKEKQSLSRFQIAIIGPSCVGKTSLMRFLVYDQGNYLDNGHTTSMDYNITKIETQRVAIWDSPGQQRYRSIVFGMCKRFKFFIFVFDLSDSGSFEQLKQIYKEFNEVVSLESKACVIGNKTDLLRKIDRDYAENYWKQKKVSYQEMSLVTDVTDSRKKLDSILKIFNLQYQLDLKKEELKQEKDKNIRLDERQQNMEKPKKKQCC